VEQTGVGERQVFPVVLKTPQKPPLSEKSQKNSKRGQLDRCKVGVHQEAIGGTKRKRVRDEGSLERISQSRNRRAGRNM